MTAHAAQRKLPLYEAAITGDRRSALKSEFAGLRRLRVDRYRIIYEVIRRELVVLAVRIGHDSRVYR